DVRVQRDLDLVLDGVADGDAGRVREVVTGAGSPHALDDLGGNRGDRRLGVVDAVAATLLGVVQRAGQGEALDVDLVGVGLRAARVRVDGCGVAERLRVTTGQGEGGPGDRTVRL